MFRSPHTPCNTELIIGAISCTYRSRSIQDVYEIHGTISLSNRTDYQIDIAESSL